MTTRVKTKHRWDTGAYGEIRSARYGNGEIALSFADGTRTTIPIDRLQSPHLHGADWSNLHFTADEIVVPASGGDVEISWFTLRALSDEEFAAYLDEFAAVKAGDAGASFRSVADEP